MNGNKYIESTARSEIMELIERTGPLTIGQVDMIRRKTRSAWSMRWLHKNGYLGILPTYPVRFCATGKKLAAPSVTVGMNGVLDALKKFGPCTSKQLAEKMDKSTEHVDTYFRAAKKAGLIHRSGREHSGLRGAGAHIWSYGPGEDIEPVKTRSKPRKTPVKKEVEQVNVRRDPFIEAMFGRAA